MEFLFSPSQFDFIIKCPRVTGSLSILGSLLTLTSLARRGVSGDNRNNHHHRFHSVYSRLLGAMSVYDILYSSMWALNRTLMPKGYGLLHTRGNEATCTLQGFLLQLGSGTFAYSMHITIYYVLTIRYNISEGTLKRRFEPFAHIATFLWFGGWAVTILKMDMIGVTGGTVCSMAEKPFLCGSNPTIECTSGQLYEEFKWFVLIGPAAVFSVVVFASLVTVTWTVRQQRRKAQLMILRHQASAATSSFNLANNNSSTPIWDDQTKQVTIQCLLYGFTFFNSMFWQCLLLLLLLGDHQHDPTGLYWLLATSLVLSPLQGVFNHLIHGFLNTIVRRKEPRQRAAAAFGMESQFEH